MLNSVVLAAKVTASHPLLAAVQLSMHCCTVGSMNWPTLEPRGLKSVRQRIKYAVDDAGGLYWVPLRPGQSRAKMVPVGTEDGREAVVLGGGREDIEGAVAMSEGDSSKGLLFVGPLVLGGIVPAAALVAEEDAVVGVLFGFGELLFREANVAPAAPATTATTTMTRSAAPTRTTRLRLRPSHWRSPFFTDGAFGAISSPAFSVM